MSLTIVPKCCKAGSQKAKVCLYEPVNAFAGRQGSSIRNPGEKRRGPFKFGNDERNAELELTWHEVSCDVMSTVGTLWRKGKAYAHI